MSDVETKDGPATTEQRFRRLNPFWKWLLIALSVASIAFSAYQVFNLGRYTGYVPIENQYFYAIVALLLPTAFIVLKSQNLSLTLSLKVASEHPLNQSRSRKVTLMNW